MKLKDLNKPLPETELCKIGAFYKTDKPGNRYTRVYYQLFKDLRDEAIDIFEIGIYRGSSISMWHHFFPNGNIYGIDNGRMIPTVKVKMGENNIFASEDDIKLLKEDAIIENVDYNWLEQHKRIKCFTADQRSRYQLNNAFNYFKCNKFDMILDDGHHFQEHQQKSLGLMFPNIKSKRYYIIEDVMDYDDMRSGKTYWGQRKKDATDSTDYIFMEFLKTGKLESPYMSEEEIKYIVDNIDDIFLYDKSNKNNSPIRGSSKLLVIRKK